MFIGITMNLCSTKILRNLTILALMSILIFSCTKGKEEMSNDKVINETNKPVKVVSSNKLKEKDGVMYELMKSVPFTGKSVLYNKDSTLIAEKTYKLGRLDGKFQIWHSNGQKHFELDWKEGKKQSGCKDRCRFCEK